MATVFVGSARSDENGKANSGKAGDQKSGKEVSTQAWYKHSKGWRVFRAKSLGVAAKIAECMEDACANNCIGYDQWQRHTLYAQAEKVGFKVRNVKANCETDCSALVRVCMAYAGITGIPEDFRTGNMPSYLLKTGAFVELTGSQYTDRPDYLGAGDILVTKSSGHTVVVISNGDKYTAPDDVDAFRLLRRGMMDDPAVKALQANLNKLGYGLTVDGDFGPLTERALKEFQAARKLSTDGIYGPKTDAALKAALALTVRIIGGQCWVRTEAGTHGRKLGVAKKNTRHKYLGQTAANGWHLIEFNGREGWVSGQYGRPEV